RYHPAPAPRARAARGRDCRSAVAAAFSQRRRTRGWWCSSGLSVVDRDDHAIPSPRPRTSQLAAGQPCLRREPHGSIARAIAAVASTLHDFEKESLLEALRVGLEILSITIAVIENVASFQRVEALR